MLYWVVEVSPGKVMLLVAVVLSFRTLTLKPAMGLKPLKVGFSHWMRRLSLVRSTTARPVGGPGGTGEEGGGKRGKRRRREGEEGKRREGEEEGGEAGGGGEKGMLIQTQSAS